MLSADFPEPSPIPPRPNPEAGLAPLLLTVVELVRQLMEAQVIRRLEAGQLSERELDRAAESLQKLEAQVLELCEIFAIDPQSLNLNLGEMGTLLPAPGTYYPGQPSPQASVLELLDRLLHTGVVLEGSVDLGIADLNLIHARLRVLLTSQPVSL